MSNLRKVVSKYLGARYITESELLAYGTDSWFDFCPECGGKFVTRCRCFIADNTCANGHVWHVVDGESVMGSGHEVKSGV